MPPLPFQRMTMLTQTQSTLTRRCPWGAVQASKVVADGIFWFSTASHGGFALSQDRYEQMPDHLKACSFTDDEFFEEDCSWCAVVIAFPDFFNQGMQAAAQECFSRFYKNRA